MPNYYYRDANNQRQGPYDGQQLRALKEQGIITPKTPLETDRKYLGLAEQFPTLNFETTSEIPDIGLARFLTPVLIAILWWLAVVMTVIFFVVLLQMGNDPSVILMGLGVAIYALISSRITLELIAIFFRMERHQRTIKEILERNEKASKP